MRSRVRGSQNIRRADIAAAGRAYVLACGQPDQDVAERNSAQQIRDEQTTDDVWVSEMPRLTRTVGFQLAAIEKEGAGLEAAELEGFL